jgi:hypothetical protein
MGLPDMLQRLPQAFGTALASIPEAGCPEHWASTAANRYAGEFTTLAPVPNPVRLTDYFFLT